MVVLMKYNARGKTVLAKGFKGCNLSSRPR